MAYELSWYKPEQVLFLALNGQPTIDELETIDREVSETLDTLPGKLSILIDAANLKTGYQTADHLRATQTYMNHPHLEWAFVVAENKLNRLITLMAFSLSRAHFVQFDDFQKAETFLKHRGLAHA